jgi:hypothetical protein
MHGIVIFVLFFGLDPPSAQLGTVPAEIFLALWMTGSPFPLGSGRLSVSDGRSF